MLLRSKQIAAMNTTTAITTDKVVVAPRYPRASAPSQRLGALSEAELGTLNCLNHVYGANLARVVLMPNSEESGLGGHVQVLQAASPIHANVTIPRTPFGVLLGARLVDADGASLHVSADRIERVHAALSQQQHHSASAANSSPTLAGHYNAAAPHKDAAPWLASVGNGDSVTVSTIKTTGGESIPFMFVRTTAGSAVGEELRAVASEPGMTAAKYAQDDRVRWARHLSRRKAERLLMIGARAAGASLRYMEDINAAVPPRHRVPQLAATADIECAYNTLSEVEHAGGGGAAVVAFYQGCADGKQSRGTAVVGGDKTASMYEFQGTTMAKTASIGNRIFNAVPAFHSQLYDQASAGVRARMRPATLAALAAKVHSIHADGGGVATTTGAVESAYGIFEEGTPYKVSAAAEAYGLDTQIPVRVYEPHAVYC